MTLDRIRLTFRLNRFELIAFGVGIAVFITISLVGTLSINSLRPPAECFASFDSLPPECQARLQEFYDAQGGLTGLSVGILIFLSFAAAVFLGVPVVARELERGTSRLAWSLAPSRIRWYLARMLPVLTMLAIATFVAGVVADQAIAASAPEADLSNSFTAFGFRGLLIAARSIFIFGVGVAVGAVIARTLPAIILTAVIATMFIAGGERIHQEILASDAVAIAEDPDGASDMGPGDMYIDSKFVLPDGRQVDYNDLSQAGLAPWDDNGNPLYPQVILAIPGERYRFVETREALALVAGSLVALLIGAFAVTRRRPG